ncbi:MAG: hypothetical protein HOF74_13765 [Gammaproteobacteria bacterium]|jgi:hypothetical protein|nr:hypothetical protein [Gammaproteobacteria bacterium]MBT3860894.1 hypothetical protein [Gammaproteobacteria bacterium]MBT3988417.1 hypothetical protein [Gammaproteobacteria bacterium]MBT4255972.1 hypothetical protein [Gammaproteobacteria bacterium]MBT4581476.1 hypothetical protein [Gammaproteobacteria bacterium]
MTKLEQYIGRYIRQVAALILASTLTACGVSNVVIDGSFPTPNISKLPLTVAVLYDDALRQFSYMEYSETGQEEINIESGQSHIQLFNAVLPAMFDNVIEVQSQAEAVSSGADAVFIPVIEEFQLALPSKTRLDVYEIWIKYNMRLESAEGDYIADWVLTSYGKTPTETFRSNEAAINEAAIVALRDLASSFSLSFSQVPEVRDWLNSQ